MKDLLEDYIDNNREAFDSEFPSLKIWADIERQIPSDESKAEAHSKTVNWWKASKIAAAVALLLVSGMVIGWHFGSSQNQINSLADISPELYEMEEFYQEQIETGKAQLVALGYKEKDVFEDLEQLEIVFNELKQEMNNTPKTSNKTLINTLINNYKTRIAILEKVFRKLDNNSEVGEFKKNEDEKTI